MTPDKVILIVLVTAGVTGTVRQLNIALDRRAFKKRNHAHPEEWDR